MWIGIIISVLIILLLLFLISKPSKSKKEEEKEKKVYAMPKQRRYPWFYTKDCHFYADGSSRFVYSENELDHLDSSLEEAAKKGDYTKAIKLADEIIKALPKTEKAWIIKINSVFSDVIQNEKCWNELLSKKILNACFGFLQCSETVLDRSLTAKHTLIPTLMKNIEELIKYQAKNVTKYHNFEVYNMLVNIYYILPFREILELLSGHLLEDKVDKDFEEDAYIKLTVKSFLSHVDMLRTRNTSRLQETFDVRKITNCTLITDEKMEANIIAFDLNFESGIDKEKIQAKFYDENNNEINFGKVPGESFVDIFEAKTTRGVTIREEIVILTDIRIARTVVSIYNEKFDLNKEKREVKEPLKEQKTEEKTKSELIEHKTDLENKLNDSKTEIKKEIELDDKTKQLEDSKSEREDNEINVAENEPNQEQEIRQEMLMYPCFEDIEDIKISNSQFVCLKKGGLVLSVGDIKCSEQIATWKDINKVYVKDNAIYAIKEDGTVMYAGNTDYENAEYIYSWDNIDKLYLADKHMLALTKNATVRAVGNNDNGQCEVDEWYDIIDLAVAFHSVGLSKDGKVHAIGENNFGECDVTAWQDIVQVAAGNFYTVGLTSMGKVVATGLNSCGQCNVSDWTNIKQIFALGNMTIGLRFDGRIVTTGKTSYRVDDVKKWNMIKQIILADNRIIGIDQDGAVFATGKPYRNFVNDTWLNVKKVVACNEHIVALKYDGTLLSNGLLFGHFLSNDFGTMLEIRENTVANKVAMLNSDNALSCMSKNQSVSEEITYPIIYGVKKADISSTHLVALKEDGLVCYYTFEDKIVTNVNEWDSIVDVKAGNNFIVGLNINGKVMAIGDNSYGQCSVNSWSDIVKIEAEGDRVAGLTIDGKLLITGRDETGEFDFLKSLQNIKSFAMSGLQTMILQNDGTVKLSFHPSGVSVEGVQSWKNVKKVVARDNNFLGLKEDGTVLSTLENETEISKWSNIDDIDASGSYTWAKLK